MIANVGNFHTLAFRLGPTGIEGVFEHHTGLLDQPGLEDLLRSLAAGELTHADVFGDHGHGALIYHPEPLPLDRRWLRGGGHRSAPGIDARLHPAALFCRAIRRYDDRRLLWAACRDRRCSAGAWRANPPLAGRRRPRTCPLGYRVNFRQTFQSMAAAFSRPFAIHRRDPYSFANFGSVGVADKSFSRQSETPQAAFLDPRATRNKDMR